MTADTVTPDVVKSNMLLYQLKNIYIMMNRQRYWLLIILVIITEESISILRYTVSEMLYLMVMSSWFIFDQVDRLTKPIYIIYHVPQCQCGGHHCWIYNVMMFICVLLLYTCAVLHCYSIVCYVQMLCLSTHVRKAMEHEGTGEQSTYQCVHLLSHLVTHRVLIWAKGKYLLGQILSNVKIT